MQVTDRQREVLLFLQQFHAQNGYMPTRAEISAGMGWKSANAAEDHLQALRRSGYITSQAGTARSLQFTEAARQLLGAVSPLPSPLPSFPNRMIALPVVDIAKVNLRRSP